MSLLNANLSSDEEDDDYRPELDKSAPKDEREEAAQLGKRRRADDEDEEQEEHVTIEEMQEMDKYDVRKQAKKLKVGHLWELLNSKPGSTPTEPDDAPASAAGTPHAKPAVGPRAEVLLASLCRTVPAKERKKMNSDLLWMRQLGITPPPKPSSDDPSNSAPAARSQPSFSSWIASADALTAHVQAAKASTGSPKRNGTTNGTARATSPVPDLHPAATTTAPTISTAIRDKPEVTNIVIDDEKRAHAAAAMAAAREGMGLGAVRQANKVTVTEKRRYAGKDIEVKVQVDKDSKEAQKAAERAAKAAQPKTGLDAFLADIEKKKKITVLDKTKADWDQAKAANTEMEEELELHKKSGNQYLDKRDFLKRAELREYEQERDKRLAADVRTRGRL